MGFTVPTDFSQTNTNYEPIPADNHIGVCIGVMDLGTHMESYQGAPAKPVRKVKIQFELPGVTRDDGKAAIISATYNMSMNEKATLRKMLDNWLGADWTEKHKGKAWIFLIGIPAMVNVQQGDSKHNPGRVVSWVSSVGRYPKGMPAPEPTRETFYLDLDHKELPAILSAWDADKIRQSKEYLAGGFDDQAPTPNSNGGGSSRPATPAPIPAAVNAPRAAAPGYSASARALMTKHGLSAGYTDDDLATKSIPADELSELTAYAVPF